MENYFISLEDIAKVCHEANKAYCESHGDNTQVSWDNAPDWQKESAINGVKFRIKYPLSTPEYSHKNWLKEKRKDGWKYGPVKCAFKKEHPCMVAYWELPIHQRIKDSLFQNIVDSMRYSLKEEDQKLCDEEYTKEQEGHE